LTKGVHVEDVLTIRYEVEKSKIWAESNVKCALEFGLRVIAIIDNGIIDIMLSRSIVLRILLPSRVEKHSVEDDITQEYGGSIFFSTPPRLEAIEALVILVFDVLIVVVSISDLDCVLQLDIVGGLELILKDDLHLREEIAVDTEENGTVDHVLPLHLLDNYFINGFIASSGPVVVLIVVWMSSIKTDKEVSVSLKCVETNFELGKIRLNFSIGHGIDFVCDVLPLADDILIFLCKINVSWIRKLSSDSKTCSLIDAAGTQHGEEVDTAR
jgi:hypothetical protein